MNLPKSKTLIILAFLMAFVPLPAAGYDLDLQSSTYLHLYQVDQVSGPEIDYAPLYEYLSLDIWEMGRPELSFHLYGWVGFDLGEESELDSADGYLSTAHLDYRQRNNNGLLRVGRIFLTEGTAMEAFDGIHVRESFGKIGFALYGGVPNEGEGIDNLDSLMGGRVFILAPGWLELGLNYLQEDGDFSGENREEAGADLWIRIADSIEITGSSVYNLSTSGLASDDISLRLSLASNLDVTVQSAGYSYEDLLQTVTNPAFHSSNINPEDEVRTMRGGFNWNLAGRFDLHGAMKSTDHKEADPGDNTRTEMGIDVDIESYFDKIGIAVSNQEGDLPENEFRELRAYCMASKGSFRWSLDALALMYEEEISGEDQTTQFVGSAGWQLSDNFDLSGDLRITRSPVYDEDLAVMLRARYDFGTGSGAN